MATPTKFFKAPQKPPHPDPQVQSTFQARGSILSLDIHPNNTQIISGSDDFTLYLWHRTPSKRSFHFSGHKGPITDCKFNSKGELIATSSVDSTIKLWQNDAKGKSLTLKGHCSAVNSVCFNSNDQLLLSGSADKTLRIWDVQSQICQLTLVGHAGSLKSALFSPDNRIIASASEDMTVKIWDLSQNKPFISFPDSCCVNSLRFHPDGTCIAAGNSEGKIRVSDIRTQRVLQQYSGHTQPINSLSFHPNGSYLLTGSSDLSLKIWDLRQGRILYTLQGHSGPVNAVKFADNGEFFVSAGDCQRLILWKSNLNENSPVNGTEKTEKFRVRVESAEKKSVQRPNSACRTLSCTGKVGSFELPDKSEKLMGSRPMQHAKRKSEIPQEVSLTIDRLVGQLETVTKTLVVLEKRFSRFEDHVSMLSTTLKGKQ